MEIRTLLRRHERGGHRARVRWTRHALPAGSVARTPIFLCGVIGSCFQTTADDGGAQGVVRNCRICERRSSVSPLGPEQD